ncbi:hypothetical protein ScPMuIL_005509 [Solemya velum]
MQALCNRTNRYTDTNGEVSGVKVGNDSLEEILQDKLEPDENSYTQNEQNTTHLFSLSEGYLQEGSDKISNINDMYNNSTTPPPIPTSDANTSISGLEDVTPVPKMTVADKTCKGCGKNKPENEELRKIRIESVKRKILDKLRMSSAPEVTKRSKLPVAILEAGIRMDDKDNWEKKPHVDPYYAETKKLFITAKDETSHCRQKRATGCYYFHLKRRVAPPDVSRAVLMIYKQWDPNDDHPHTFIVSELESNKHSQLRARNRVDRIEQKKTRGWIEIDITATVTKWLDRPQTNDGLSITCKSCRRQKHTLIYGAKDGLIPTLIITTKKGSDRHRRLRRNGDCSPSSESCCRAELTVRFAEIGWSWVLYPDSIRVNYCRGSCNQITDVHNNHTVILQTTRWGAEDEATFRDMEPCCAPTAWAPQSMLIEQKGAYVKVEVPNLLVEACGCT